MAQVVKREAEQSGHTNILGESNGFMCQTGVESGVFNRREDSVN